jgi:putative endonuclease
MITQAYVYFLTNKYNSTLYLGVTSNIIRRIVEHKTKVNKGFSSRYNCEKLVYFESHNSMSDAIAREKQLKDWKREWKSKLIDKTNPTWRDLSDEIGVTQEVVSAVSKCYNHHLRSTEEEERS